MQALARVPVESRHYFWLGQENAPLSKAVGSARRTVSCLCRITGIYAHTHRFRETFSVELLTTGADLRTVQKQSVERGHPSDPHHHA